MKVVFIGGGALRHLSILRSAMAVRPMLDGGEVNLYDINRPRAEAMGRMVMKTPEYRAIDCKVSWGTSLGRALDGADAVSVVLRAGSARSFALGGLASRKHGFINSDQISPNGAFLALKGGPLLMGFARKMEKRCPKAWLLDFANPVPVLSAAVNNHTRIKALGVCSGYSNHGYDLMRLMGSDEECTDFDLHVAGVNHCSFVLRGSLHGTDLYKLLAKHITPDWRPPRLKRWWTPIARKHIRYGLRRCVELYRKFGVVLFSMEFDGMSHLFYEQMERYMRRPVSRAKIRAGLRREPKGREAADREFRAHLDRELDEAFWARDAQKGHLFRRDDNHIIVRCLRGIAGLAKVKIATSRPNEGAVAGIKPRTVLEYSQIIHKQSIEPAGRYEIPDPFHGLMTALATHQTLLGDAIATRDPRILYQALYAYPVKPNTRAARALYRDLLEINKDEIPRSFQKAKDYL